MRALCLDCPLAAKSPFLSVHHGFHNILAVEYTIRKEEKGKPVYGGKEMHAGKYLQLCRGKASDGGFAVP